MASKNVDTGLLPLFVCYYAFFLGCTPFEKSNFCPKIPFWQNPNIFTSFSPPKKSTIFYGKSKLNFWTKNEDIEQCVENLNFWGGDDEVFMFNGIFDNEDVRQNVSGKMKNFTMILHVFGGILIFVPKINVRKKSFDFSRLNYLCQSNSEIIPILAPKKSMSEKKMFEFSRQK